MLDVLKPKPGVEIPKGVEERRKRGREAMLRGGPQRRLNWHFWRGNQYWYLNEKSVLRFQDTVTHASGGGKPHHRVRQTRNIIHGIVEDKVSTATRRTPSYDVAPATTDPEDWSAADVAQKVALYGYDKWGVRRARVKTVTNAFVGGEGFAYPYFDRNVGPFHKSESGEVIGEGEIKILVLDGNQVYWEEGCDFEESPWWAIERARPVDEVEKIPGYLGGKLKPDADASDNPTERRGKHLVLVTEYFERPCVGYPDGRKLTLANERMITLEEQFPVRDTKGNAVDEPPLHRLSYTVDPGQDRDRSLVEHLIDPQRTVNDCVNKLLEWKNRCLNPRLLAEQGSMQQNVPEAPGATVWYRRGQQAPQWEKPPQIPRELFELLNQAIQHAKEISADAEVAAQADLAAKTVQAVLEKAQSRWATFLLDLAEFDSKLMRACLTLAARHYSEKRTLQVRGTYGWAPIQHFKGADLRGQVDVRVLPDSLEPQTRQGRRDEVELLLRNFPGYFKPEAAMAALQGGLAENLIQSYKKDVTWAHRMIEIIKLGPEVTMSLPDRFDREAVDPETGQPGTMVPGYMPRKTDNVEVIRTVVADFTKGDEFMALPDESKEQVEQILDACDFIEMERAQRQQMMQMDVAAQQGLQNAAAPQEGGTTMPSQPGQQAA